MINVLPRAALRNPSYFLNRKIDHLVLKDVQNPSQVVVDMVGQLSGPREQIAVLAVGQPLDFATPWTANLENVTVRDVFDFIAKQLGPAYGWQFSGALDFRVITFHAGLLPEAGRTKRQ